MTLRAAPAKDGASGYRALGLDSVQQLSKQRWVDARKPGRAERFGALGICCLAEPAQLSRDLSIVAIDHEDLDRTRVLERDPKREYHQLRFGRQA